MEFCEKSNQCVIFNGGNPNVQVLHSRETIPTAHIGQKNMHESMVMSTIPLHIAYKHLGSHTFCLQNVYFWYFLFDLFHGPCLTKFCYWRQSGRN